MHVVLVDVGNSATKIALATEDSLLWHKVLKTQPVDTLIQTLQAQTSGLNPDLCLLCSVVPSLNAKLIEILKTCLHSPVKLVPQEIPIPLATLYTNPAQLGSDRLAAAYAAKCLYSTAATQIIVDVGTALTIDCVSQECFQGGFILAGPKLALNALAQHTALLPKIKLAAASPSFHLGRTTTECIAQGALYGTIVQIEGLCARIKQCFQAPHVIVGTGGFIGNLQHLTSIFTAIYPELVLEGLRCLACHLTKVEQH
ncbi:MAG: type III pantothenate kinase [Desulfovibrionaceae bacterium]|nr:type III pantothenate kinase [Desulfovibrionaceae bacterium]